MKIRDFSAVKYYSKKLGKEFHSHTTFGEIVNWKKVKRLLPNSNIVVFPKKYVAWIGSRGHGDCLIAVSVLLCGFTFS